MSTLALHALHHLADSSAHETAQQTSTGKDAQPVPQVTQPPALAKAQHGSGEKSSMIAPDPTALSTIFRTSGLPSRVLVCPSNSGSGTCAGGFHRIAGHRTQGSVACHKQIASLVRGGYSIAAISIEQSQRRDEPCCTLASCMQHAAPAGDAACQPASQPVHPTLTDTMAPSPSRM